MTKIKIGDEFVTREKNNAFAGYVMKIISFKTAEDLKDAFYNHLKGDGIAKFEVTDMKYVKGVARFKITKHTARLWWIRRCIKIKR